MNINTLVLSEYGRGEFNQEKNLVIYDRINSKLINRMDIRSGEDILIQFNNTTGYFYEFFDWNKVTRCAALFLDNDQLIFNYEQKEYKIENVKVIRFLLWKKIMFNDLTVKVYSPVCTIFMATDMFPEDVEPIYGQFSNLLCMSQIQEQVNFFKLRKV